MDPLKTSTAPETKLHFLDYWRIIRIRKTVILAVFLLVVITATIVTLILPEAYSSKARIKVERDATDVPGVGGQAPLMGGVYDPYFIQTEFEVIQSEKVLDKVIAKLNLNEAWQKKYHTEGKFKTTECRMLLKKMIELRPERNTSLIDITVYSDDKDEAATIANAVAEEYRLYRKNLRADLIQSGIDAFTKEVKTQDDKVTDMEAQVDKLRRDLKVTDTDPQSTGPGGTLGTVDVLHYNSLKIDAETQHVKEAEALRQFEDLCNSSFVPGDITDLPALAKRLADKSDAAAGYLSEQMGDSLAAKIADYNANKANADKLQAFLIEGINKLVAGPSLYDNPALKGIKVRPLTTDLHDRKVLKEKDLKLCNRMVIEDVFPTELSRHQEALRQALPTALVPPDGNLNMLLQDLDAAKQKLVTLKADFGASHPQVLQIALLIEELNTQIDHRVEGIMAGKLTTVGSLKAVVDNAVAKVDEAKTNDMAIAERSRPYFLAKADLDRVKKFRDVLYLRTAQEKVEEVMPRTAMVVPIDSAEPGMRPVRPNKPLNIALGIIIGLVVGVGLAFFIEYLDTSVKTIDDVERSLQAPVLGVIPQNVGVLMEEGAESPHAEAYRVLRTNLLFSRKDDKLNTIAVVSAGAGEGKSTTVCNLATVFSQSGQRVIMVDSDLRRPTLHKMMGVTNALGLTNYLLKQNTLEEVIQTTNNPSLDLLASGKLPSSSLGILSSTQMKDLIHELKQRYDFVFFDSPPIMGVSDASILASEVDMTLQVIQYRRYPQPMNIRAKQLIEKVGGNLIGIVLNNINMSQDESYYYYSGYYHDYYYTKNESDPGPAKTNGKPEDKPRVDIKPKY